MSLPHDTTMQIRIEFINALNYTVLWNPGVAATREHRALRYRQSGSKQPARHPARDSVHVLDDRHEAATAVRSAAACGRAALQSHVRHRSARHGGCHAGCSRRSYRTPDATVGGGRLQDPAGGHRCGAAPPPQRQTLADQDRSGHVPWSRPRPARKGCAHARRRRSHDNAESRSIARPPISAPTAWPSALFDRRRFFVEGDDVLIENLTIENGAGPVGQAVALRVDGDRVVIRNSRLLGWQDTLLLNRGRQYLEDTFIAGHVDFVFGAATAYFSRCHLHAWRDGYLTAASTPADQPYGFVFVDGIVTGEPEVKTYLGRPWRDFAQTTFVRTVMGAAVVGAGWHNWDQPAREKTARYGEFGSSGPGALNLGARVAWSRRLTADEASRLTPAAVLGGADKWNPLAIPATKSAHQANAAPLPPPPGPAAVIAAWQTTTVTWDRILQQRADWYRSADALRIAENVVLWQRHTGGWPKNIDMARPLSDDERAQAARRTEAGRLDDRQRRLGRADPVPRDASSRPAARSSGRPCWPDSSICSRRSTPTADGLSTSRCGRTIRGTSPSTTTPSSTCSGFLATSRWHARRSPDWTKRFAPAHAAPSSAATRSCSRLRSGSNGTLTGWCQQYDEITLQPAGARTYEHPSISGLETSAILTYLMKIDKPDAATIAAIEAGMAWLVEVADSRPAGRAEARSGRARRIRRRRHSGRRRTAGVGALL